MADRPNRQAGPADRPAVSIVVPFGGGVAEARGLFECFSRVERELGDEIVIVDNSDHDLAAQSRPGGVRVVSAVEERSSYYARNVGAEAASNEWLLFVDADCEPDPGVLDRYFDDHLPPSCGAVAGEVDSARDGLLSRYAASRGLLRQRVNLAHPYRPSAVTANLLVRRDAWESVGGFLEGIRSGGDGDFCWRLQAAGWELEYRPAARVLHRHRERLGPLARQVARHAAGAAWLNRRHPGASPRPRLGRPLARCAAGMLGWTAAGRFERAAFKAVDAVVIGASWLGYGCGNAAPARRGQGEITVIVDALPRVSETFVVEEVRAMRRLGYRVTVEAVSRPVRPLRGGARGMRARYLEDDSVPDRLRALAWLATTRPIGCLRDLAARRRWRPAGERTSRLASLAPVARRIRRAGSTHLHVHFAASAALDAMRLASLLRLPYSVTAHAYEIFAEPRNLREKLERAAFVTTGCEYNLAYLQNLLGGDTAGRIHEIVMGVDLDRFTRTTPLAGGRVVAGVGRLVEKKGFEDLLEAAAVLAASGRGLQRVELAGEGPLLERLEGMAERAGLGEIVRFHGALEPDAVRELLEGVDALAMPCVLAANGDRDSMPVVVKEAMALELLVVGSDEVGLPELIGSRGRLVPPGDAAALAAALDDVLSLPPEDRRVKGREARAWVAQHANVETETARLLELMRVFGGLSLTRSCERGEGRVGPSTPESRAA